MHQKFAYVKKKQYFCTRFRFEQIQKALNRTASANDSSIEEEQPR